MSHLPPGWTKVALGEVAVVDRSTIRADEITRGTLYIGLEDIEAGGTEVRAHPVESGELGSNKFRFDRSHILYGKLRPYLAKIAAAPVEGICSTDILPIRPTKVDQRYLLHFLRQPAMVDYATARSSGANLPRLAPKELERFTVPLPPLEEQRRIAAILDKADELRAKRRSALDKLDSLTQSIFLDMFGDPVTNPMQWPEGKVLGDVGEVVSGITKGRRATAPTRSVPYMAVANVQDKRLVLDSVKTIDATEAEIERYRIRSGDLLLTEGGDPDKLGRGTVWRGELPEAIHQNHIFRVRPDTTTVTPDFLAWLVGSERGKRYFLRSAKQTTGIASINATQLRSFPMLLPPLERQREFDKAVAAVRSAQDRADHSGDDLDSLFASLQQRAFRGEL